MEVDGDEFQVGGDRRTHVHDVTTHDAAQRDQSEIAEHAPPPAGLCDTSHL